jgi:hypothetical protein
MNRRPLLAATLSFVTIGGTLVAVSPAGAAPMAGQQWLVKANDLAVLGGQGTYQWVGCGTTTGLACQPGQVPIFTDYDVFVQAVDSGQVVAGDTVIFDNEDWSYTPSWEQRNQEKYEVAAAVLAREHGIVFINTPAAKTFHAILKEDVAAARYASVVEIQSQAMDNSPQSFIGHVKKAVAAILAVSATVTILAGLATDALGRPTTVARMLDEYQGTRASVQGYWLNANPWPAPRGRGCAPQGCPAIGRQFLTDIGAQ